MPLHEPNLDDLRFQRDLVDVARKRIIHYCPEWTDYNISDPGITLIELFAWMTELIVYRLNRVPEKNFIKFLNMLGTDLQPPTSARADLLFRLAVPLPLRPQDETVAVVPKGTEIGTRILDDEPEVIFTTDERLMVVPPILTQLRRTDDFHKNYLERLNIELCPTFNPRNPQQGDTLYFGFDEKNDLSGHILRLEFTCEPTQAPGIRRDDPPLVWECSLGDGLWHELTPSTHPDEADTTGGLNNEQGSLTFYLPTDMQPDAAFGREALWVRVRFEQRRATQGFYSESPRITGVVASSLGASTKATHAVYVHNELLGSSDGEPGQLFQLRFYPTLALNEEEVIEVEEIRDGESTFVRWEYVEDFAMSTRFDRHFNLNTATGEISFGPAIRQPDGSVKQYGRIPEMDRQIQMRQYRYGGGVLGNVPSGEIQVMKTALPYIDRVTNPERSSGGLDQESMDEAKMRARRELRAQERAVTPNDFELLTKRITQAIGRVRCSAPMKIGSTLPPGMVELLVVPSVAEALVAGDLSKLQLPDELSEQIRTELDEYRLLTATLYIREPHYLGVKVTVEIVPIDNADPDLLRTQVINRLNHMLNPLPLPTREPLGELLAGVPEDTWEGWPFGRDLYVADVFSLLQQVPMVKHVLDVRFGMREVVPVNELSPVADEDVPDILPDPPALERMERVVPVPDDALVCSLPHDVLIRYL